MLSNLKFPEGPLSAQLFLEGKWQKGSGPILPVISPLNGQIMGNVTSGTEDELNRLCRFAQKAQKEWGQKTSKDRAQVMFKFREILLRDLDLISQRITLESGKTIAEARAGLLKGIEVVEYATSLPNIDKGGKSEVSQGVHCEYRRVPLGLVASITPFNFPAMVPLWTIPLAIGLGNALVWKPSEKTPLTAEYIANSLSEAGLPPGIFNIFHGAKEAVDLILNHKEIKAVSFVGSTKVAKYVYEQGARNFKRVLALGGAKNHIILLPDADEVICGRGISDSFTGCAGQRCMAASVLLAVGPVDAQIERIIERAKSLQLGSDMGAIITRSQREFLYQSIEKAEKDGAKISLDGRKSSFPKGFENGHWIGPTIIDHVKPDSELAKNELFGPVLSIIRCTTLKEAMDIENANPYGNACSVFTSHGASAEYVIARASAGMVGVNVGVPVPREPFSFGGIYDSKFGHGDITGEGGLEFWSDIKKVTVKWEQNFSNWMS